MWTPSTLRVPFGHLLLADLRCLRYALDDSSGPVGSDRLEEASLLCHSVSILYLLDPPEADSPELAPRTSGSVSIIYLLRSFGEASAALSSLRQSSVRSSYSPSALLSSAM